jgi:histone H3/H4
MVLKLARALREINFYQGTSSLLIQRRPFQRLIKEILDESTGHIVPGPFKADRMSLEAYAALQTMAEFMLVSLFEMSYVLCDSWMTV